MKMRIRVNRRQREVGCSEKRRAGILVLAAASLVMILAFTAFSVDVGYITLTRTQLQAAADASALAAGLELQKGFGADALSASEVEALAKSAAVAVAARHRAGDKRGLYVNPIRDLRFGQVQWHEDGRHWEKTWGVAPYNMVEVTLRRIPGESESSGDSALPLFFAPVLGTSTANITVHGVAAMAPGVGFAVRAGETGGIAPFVIHEDAWTDMLSGVGDDNWAWDDDNQSVSAGTDNIIEMHMYPITNNPGGLTAGNFGTVDFGAANNSTADLSRQILEGVNGEDMAYFGGEIRLDESSMELQGDTGISSGMADELEAILGEVRVIPLYTTVTDSGNNSMFTIVKFVGVRFMAVNLHREPKSITVQPAVFMGENVIKSSNATIDRWTFFTNLMLIE